MLQPIIIVGCTKNSDPSFAKVRIGFLPVLPQFPALRIDSQPWQTL